MIPAVVRVLLELWMLSKTENVELWATLEKLTVNWMKVPVIGHWQALSLSLSNRVFSAIYGSQYGTTNLSIEWFMDDKLVPASFEMDARYAFYAWQKILHVLPNPCTITDPDVFQAAFFTIDLLVQNYLRLIESLRRDSTVCNLIV